MSRGRPVCGPQLVESLQGSPAAKQRIQLILETLSGARTVAAACAELGLSESRFHELRAEILQHAVAAAEPRPLGRPPTPPPAVSAEELERLKRQNLEMRIQVEAAQIREELALVMPQVLKPRRLEKKRDPRFPASRPPPRGASAATPPSSATSGASNT